MTLIGLEIVPLMELSVTQTILGKNVTNNKAHTEIFLN